ncbi:hypothetical protein [Aquibacillus sediminis]|nr:hypothetical protein [Aquibacillus sediminis]
MLKVQMIVQTTYNGKILRKGKEYEVNESTARRWDASKIAKIVEEQ